MAMKKVYNFMKSGLRALSKGSGKRGTTRGPARNQKTNTNTKDLQSKVVKKKNTTKKVLKDTAKVGTGVAIGYGIGKGGSQSKGSTPPKPKSRPKKKMAQVDSFSKSRVKQGPPKGPMKKKKRSNIINSSSYDPIFAAKVSKVKKKGMITGPEMMKKKKDNGKAPMYEMGGTMGGVKKTKYASMGMSGKKTKYAAKGMSGKKTKYAAKGMKMSKYYSSGGRVFSGR